MTTAKKQAGSGAPRSTGISDAVLDPKEAFVALQKEVLERYRIAERPLALELHSLGLPVDSAWRLANSPTSYDLAIPVLLRHLRKKYPPLVREGIARAIGVRWARALAWSELISIYESEPNFDDVAPPGEMGAPSGPKNAMANGIADMARHSDLNKLLDLIRDFRNGPTRIAFIARIARVGSERALEALAELVDDPDIGDAVRRRLRDKLKRRSKAASPSGSSE